MELPRGCDYWKDKRIEDIMNGADCHVHDFDGCMYGLKTKFSPEEESLKKPWRIVSWGVDFPGMRKKCDHSHDHGKCAGRETRGTQQYADKIIRNIVNRISHVVMNKVKVANPGKPYQRFHPKDCEDWKRHHSLFS